MQWSNETPVPLALEKREKRSTSDGAHRASLPDETLRKFSCLIGPSGIVEDVKATYRELSSKAIHPNICMNFSARQYQQREERNRRDADFNWVPETFDEDREI